MITIEQEKQKNAQHFLDIIQKSRRGKFKIYNGVSGGNGKSFGMLHEAHTLSKNGINVKIGYIEAHIGKETHELLGGLPIVPGKTIFYKGKQLEEIHSVDTKALLIYNNSGLHKLTFKKNGWSFRSIICTIQLLDFTTSVLFYL